MKREFNIHNSRQSYAFQVPSIRPAIFSAVGRLNSFPVNFGPSIGVFYFCTVDQSGHDYQAISSMHIDRLIAAVRFRLRLIFFVSCIYFSLSSIRFPFPYIPPMYPRYVCRGIPFCTFLALYFRAPAMSLQPS